MQKLIQDADAEIEKLKKTLPTAKTAFAKTQANKKIEAFEIKK